MSLPPTYFISSSVIQVENSIEKILMLPTASTIKDIPLIIRTYNAGLTSNSIIVSTQAFDLIDQYASTILIGYDQSLRFIPYSTTRYTVTKLFNGDITPYLG